MAPGRRHPDGEGLRAARARRRGLPHRHEVGLHPAGRRQAGLPGRQRGRVRAGHLQGHPADDGQPARAGGGHRHRLLRDPRGARLHLRPRRGRARAAPAAGRGAPRRTRRATPARTSSAPASTSRSSCTPAPAPTSAARRRRCSTRSRAAAASPGCAPPFPAIAGLYASPTVINNVESIASVPSILRNGADWFRAMGTEARDDVADKDKPRFRSKGMTLFSLSGHVNRPGQYEAPMGITLRELLDLSGGVRDGPPAQVLDAGRLVDADPDRRAPRRTAVLRRHRRRRSRCSAPRRCRSSTRRPASSGRCCAGPSSTRTSRAASARRAARAPTGWCRSCAGSRSGEGSDEDLEKLLDICDNILGRSFCALGDGATSPITSSLEYFRDEYLAHFEHGGCPFDPAAATLFEPSAAQGAGGRTR